MNEQELKDIERNFNALLLRIPVGATFRDGPLAGASIYNVMKFARQAFLGAVPIAMPAGSGNPDAPLASAEGKYRANFLVPFDDDSLEEAAFEFSNGHGEDYQAMWFRILVERAADPEARARWPVEK